MSSNSFDTAKASARAMPTTTASANPISIGWAVYQAAVAIVPLFANSVARTVDGGGRM